MEKVVRDQDPAKFALVRLNSTNDALKLHRYLVSIGFPEISFVKEVSQLYTPDEELTSFVLQSSTKNIGRIRKQNKRKDEEKQILQNGNGVESEGGLTASVIAALSSLAQGCLLKEEIDGDQRASSSCTTSHDPSPETQTAIPSPIPFVARPRGSRMQNSDDPTVYASCKLCSNKIMSSRLSNLTNHVRRHAALKQYQCCHCGYSHNEMAKVRLHMQHNHSDFESSPIDGMCKEMQQQWANLMEQCFPGHAKRFAQNNSFVAINDSPVEKNVEVKPMSSGDESEMEMKFKDTVVYPPVSPSDVFACSRCGEVVQSAKLLTHLVQRHSDDCYSFACSECNFLANFPWKIVLHIANEHHEKPGENSVVMTPSGTNYLLHVPIYFPEFAKRRGYTIEDNLLRADFEQKCADYLQHDLAALKAVQCELCFKLFTADQNISVLLTHARNHFGIRSFTCPECPFKSTETTIVSSHISRKHPECGEQPIDNSIENNKEAWQKLACYCFPDLEHNLIEALSDSRRTDLKRKSTTQLETSPQKQIR